MTHAYGRTVIDLTGEDDEDPRAAAFSGLPAGSLNASQSGDSLDRALPANHQQEPRRARNAVTKLFHYGVQQLQHLTGSIAARVKSGPRPSTEKTRKLHNAWQRRRSPARALSARTQESALVRQEPLPAFENLVRSIRSGAASPSAEQQTEPGESYSEPGPNSALLEPPRSYVFADAFLADPSPSPGLSLSQSAGFVIPPYESPALPPRRSLPWHPATEIVSLISSSPSPPVHPQAAGTGGTANGFVFDPPAGAFHGAWPRHEAGTMTNPIELSDSEEDDVTPPPVNVPPSAGQSELTLFADGSFIENRWGGAGVAYMKNGTWSGRAVALGQVRTSLVAEMEALYEAFRLARELLRPEHGRLSIQTDSMSALHFTGNGRNSGYYERLKQTLLAERRSLRSSGVDVELSWVKGHSISAGNEMADLLAGMASKEARNGNTPRFWNDPDLGPVAISSSKMKTMSARVEAVTNWRRIKLHGGARETDAKAERRNRKLQMRRLVAVGARSS